jgi:hypothetical protein
LTADLSARRRGLNSFQIVGIFRANDKCPEWLIALEPLADQPGEFGRAHFQIDCCVVETPTQFFLVPDRIPMTHPFYIRIDHGGGVDIKAASKPVVLPMGFSVTTDGTEC